MYKTTKEIMDDKLTTISESKNNPLTLKKVTLVCPMCRTATMTGWGALNRKGTGIRRFVKIEGGGKVDYHPIHGVLCNECLKTTNTPNAVERCPQCTVSLERESRLRVSHVAEKEGIKVRFCSKVCEQAFDLFAAIAPDTMEQWETLHPKPTHSPIFRTYEKPDDAILIGLIHCLDKSQTSQLLTKLARIGEKASWIASRYTENGWQPVLEETAIALTENITITLPLPIAILAELQKIKEGDRPAMEHTHGKRN